MRKWNDAEAEVLILLATWCKELTHWKRPQCRKRLRAGEVGNWGWDVWMASPTQWTWIWANSGRWWRTGKPGLLQSVRSQRVRHNLVTKQQVTWIHTGEGGVHMAVPLSLSAVPFCFSRHWRTSSNAWAECLLCADPVLGNCRDKDEPFPVLLPKQTGWWDGTEIQSRWWGRFTQFRVMRGSGSLGAEVGVITYTWKFFKRI